MIKKIVAHRGASAEAPENTLEAFALAIELGADMIEFDVRRDRAGTLRISHDAIREPATELPTLEETLRLTQGRIQLDVELKEPGCERDAIDLLLRYFAPADFCVTSFLASALHETRRIDPRIRTGLIFALWNREARTVAASADCDVLMAQSRLVNKVENVGKPVFVWTVDNLALTRELLKRPLVEGIVTNDPRRALALRAEAA
ncbi:MAG TPA: glycerophosphodiester phosphodiesterase [Bryobacteraceae bacterium]|nr:glycerophosphodiester phosphodiesterase [Bryobacteraceae bacterium]